MPFEHPWRVGAMAVLCGMLLLGLWAFQSWRSLQKLDMRLAGELEQEEAMHRATIQSNAAAHSDALRKEKEKQGKQASEEMVRHRELMGDVALLSGDKARLRHEEEWSRRRAYAPEFAITAIERVMLRMHQVAGNKELPMEKVMEEVALLASPAGSQAEVRRRDGRLLLNVAFRMSALSSKEAGAVTAHTSKESLRNEAINLCARVMRDVYEHCGTRDIDRVQLSCNHAVQQARVSLFASEYEKRQAFAGAPVVWSVLYRCSLPGRMAEKVPKWHDASMNSIKSMLAVQEDRFSTLTISGHTTSGSQRDPEAPLKFE